MYVNTPSFNDLIQMTLSEFEPSPIINALKLAAETATDDLAEIEKCFSVMTRDLTEEMAPYFFHSWSLTNHSAMAVSAIGNKMTRQYQQSQNADPGSFLQALSALHRISDEDLGATGGTLHHDLFYNMAYEFCNSDTWLSRKYAIPAALEFKKYRHKNVVRTSDQLHALLATTIHEIYTHAEVEFILPLFQEAAKVKGLRGRQAARAVAWIKVHCGGTERDHFGHALDAVDFWCKAVNADLKDYDLTQIFGTYFHHKSQVMKGLLEMMPAHVLVV